MKRIVAVLAALFVLGLGGSVFAQDDGAGPDTMFYDFNDMLIDGEFQRPEGMFATERGRARFESLLSLRRSFIDEIEEAAHEEALEK